MHVDYIFNTADTKGHWDAMVELIAPQGKSAGFIWELMFTRSLFSTADIQTQQYILFQVANLIDSGRLKSMLTTTLQGFSVETLKEAHQLIEAGSTIGKTAIKY